MSYTGQRGLTEKEVKVIVTEMCQGRAAVGSPESQRKEGLGDRFRGLAGNELTFPAAPLVASVVRTLRA